MRGKFITIEGTEGAGKSTVMTFLRQWLQVRRPDAVFTREPGGTVIAENIRQVLLRADENEKMQPETELLLMFAGRAQHIGHCVLPALQAGKCVVSDRFIDASYAYQGGGRGIPMAKIEMLDKMVVGDLYPDLTLLLDVPVEIGLARTAARSAGPDRIERERVDFFERVREIYLQRARQQSDRIKVIDASRAPDQVQQQIARVIETFFEGQA